MNKSPVAIRREALRELRLTITQASYNTLTVIASKEDHAKFIDIDLHQGTNHISLNYEVLKALVEQLNEVEFWAQKPKA